MYHATHQSPDTSALLRFDHEIDRDEYVSADPQYRRPCDPPEPGTRFTQGLVRLGDRNVLAGWAEVPAMSARTPLDLKPCKDY